MTRILVTGASGFVGKQVLRSFSEVKDIELYGTARRPFVADGVRVQSLDLFDAAATRLYLSEIKPNVLIHCAWFVDHGRFWNDSVNVKWVSASKCLARAFIDSGGSRFVGVGTMAEYDWRARQPMSEDSPLRSDSLYGRAKLELSLHLKGLARSTATEIAWARLFLLYGENEDFRRFVPTIARAVISGKVAQCTHGSWVRDFLDVRDAGAAISALALSDIVGSVNVASGVGVSQADVAGIVARLAGDQTLLELRKIPDREVAPKEITADVRRLQEEVGFVPTTSLENGLANAVAFWRSG
jgi:nucleoside-diphosphate-sugar epimerase